MSCVCSALGQQLFGVWTLSLCAGTVRCVIWETFVAFMGRNVQEKPVNIVKAHGEEGRKGNPRYRNDWGGWSGVGGAPVVVCWPLFQQRAVLVQAGWQSSCCTAPGSAGLCCLLDSEPFGMAGWGRAAPVICNRWLREDWEELSEYLKNLMVNPVLQDEALSAFLMGGFDILWLPGESVCAPLLSCPSPKSKCGKRKTCSGLWQVRSAGWLFYCPQIKPSSSSLCW